MRVCANEGGLAAACGLEGMLGEGGDAAALREEARTAVAAWIKERAPVGEAAVVVSRGIEVEVVGDPRGDASPLSITVRMSLGAEVSDEVRDADLVYVSGRVMLGRRSRVAMRPSGVSAGVAVTEEAAQWLEQVGRAMEGLAGPRRPAVLDELWRCLAANEARHRLAEADAALEVAGQWALVAQEIGWRAEGRREQAGALRELAEGWSGSVAELVAVCSSMGESASEKLREKKGESS